MATRSTIALRRTDGTMKKIYCHWDGYLEHNGAILQKYYSTADKVENLLALGNLSVLGPTAVADDTWESRDFLRCKPYTLRGEKREYAAPDQMEEYNYLFDESEGCWIVTEETSCKPGEAADALGFGTLYDCYETHYLIDRLAELPEKDWASMAPADENDWGVTLEECMEAAREARRPINEQRAAHHAAYYSAYCD